MVASAWGAVGAAFHRRLSSFCGGATYLYTPLPPREDPFKRRRASFFLPLSVQERAQGGGGIPPQRLVVGRLKWASTCTVNNGYTMHQQRVQGGAGQGHGQWGMDGGVGGEGRWIKVGDVTGSAEPAGGALGAIPSFSPSPLFSEPFSFSEWPQNSRPRVEPRLGS